MAAIFTNMTVVLNLLGVIGYFGQDKCDREGDIHKYDRCPEFIGVIGYFGQDKCDCDGDIHEYDRCPQFIGGNRVFRSR